MPVDKSLKVGDRANEGPEAPIILTSDWLKDWGQIVPVRARNKDNDEVEGLKDGLNGFYVYKISCKCDGVQRSGLESVIKIGRSAAPVKQPKNTKEDGTLEYGGIRERLRSYPMNYSMNDTELLMVILFHYTKQAQNFESTIKNKLNKTRKYKAVGKEWFDAKYEKEIMETIKDHIDWLKRNYRPTVSRSATPAPAPAPPRVTPPPPERVRSGPKPKPAPPVSAPVDKKKAYVKNAAMKVRNQAIRDGKPAAFIAEAYRKEQDKWNAHYGL